MKFIFEEEKEKIEVKDLKDLLCLIGGWKITYKAKGIKITSEGDNLLDDNWRITLIK